MQAHADSGEETPFFEQIENYLSGNLSPDQRSRVENRFLLDAAFAEEKTSYQALVAGIKATQRKRLIEDMRKQDAIMSSLEPEVILEATTQPFKISRTTAYYWAVAAVVLILLIPTYAYFKQRQKAEYLFSSFFAPYYESTIPISEEAQKLYRQGNYASAVEMLEEAEKMIMNDGKEQDLEEAANQFYQGNAYLALDNPEEAITCFQNVLKNPSEEYHQESEWYLTLSYLKAKKGHLAKPLAEKISQTPGHQFAKAADELLKQF
jgi:tetratricopeptide (TPR) repeat protein